MKKHRTTADEYVNSCRMVSFLVRQLFHDKTLGLNLQDTGLRDQQFAAATIYLIRDGTTVIYVGMSETDVVERLQTHIGREFRGRAAKSDLGMLIEANHPESESWVVELFTPEECRWVVPDGESFVTINSRDAEWSMIRHFKPCLNVTANHFRATPLPTHYRRPAFWSRG